MKPLQALLIQGEEMRDAVLEGRKKISIRTGHREYEVGKPILIGCDYLNWSTKKTVTSVTFTTFNWLSDVDIKEDGFEDALEAFEVLKKFYPELKGSSEVTVVRWI